VTKATRDRLRRQSRQASLEAVAAEQRGDVTAAGRLRQRARLLWLRLWSAGPPLRAWGGSST
jgi:hypothetical protein